MKEWLKKFFNRPAKKYSLEWYAKQFSEAEPMDTPESRGAIKRICKSIATDGSGTLYQYVSNQIGAGLVPTEVRTVEDFLKWCEPSNRVWHGTTKGGGKLFPGPACLLLLLEKEGRLRGVPRHGARK